MEVVHDWKLCVLCASVFFFLHFLADSFFELRRFSELIGAFTFERRNSCPRQAAAIRRSL